MFDKSQTKVSYMESKMYSSVKFRWTDPNCSKLVFTPPSGWFRLVAGEAIDHDNSSVPAPLSSQQRQRFEKNIDKSPINRAFTDSATHKRQYIKIELFCFLIKLQVFQPRFQANSARVAKKNIDRGTTDTAFTR